MLPDLLRQRARGRRHRTGGALCALWVAACAPLHPAPQPPAASAEPAAAKPAAPAPAPAPPPEPAKLPQADPVSPADLTARRLLAYHERLRQMSMAEVAAEVARLGALVSSDPPASPDDVLALALALMQERGPGDLARAASLLDSITQGASPETQPWQPLARLLQVRVAEERRLEDELERQTSMRRDTQRAIQQLSEKLEALKAIERSMTAHPASTPQAGSGSAPGAETTPPPAPKTP
jgi:hypothetical protein